jgi:2,4-dienoyl-CoA reductase-like NADH-dependent reductase (Old Yellow Enzyme family)/NADPH-dependent 2,4-dienoyl-CoA reductase/sulfur reductase-like enzyme
VTNKKYPHLLSPIKIGPLTLKNRMASAPTSLATLGPNGYPSAENVAYYELRAKGGACMVTLGDTIIHPSGLAHPEAVLLTDPNILPHLIRVSEAIRKHGAVASIEIDHGGANCWPEYTPDHRVIGPSSFVHPRTKAHVEAMSVDEIHEMAKRYGEAAAVGKKTGFQMVTLHAGHGWLLSQFLTPLTNHRTDEYGGSIENRTRFLLEAIACIREACGRDFPIEVRMSGSDLIEGGNEIAQGIEIAKAIDGKVDLIHVSAGNLLDGRTGTFMHPSMFLEHGCNVHFAADIKKAVKTPVATVGSLSEPRKMEEIIASGQADIVCMARALLADPFLPRKVQYGLPENIRPCLRCFNCQGGMFATRTLRCSVNPVIGHELAASIPIPTTPSRKVLIAGGGPAGIQAALTAVSRGHEVLLFEKGGDLGGALRYARHVSFKCYMEDYRQFLIHQVDDSKIEAYLNTEVTPELIQSIKPDIVIAAVGAEPIIPKLPGVDGPNVLLAVDAHAKIDELGMNVVVIGGGLVGTELGIELGKKGKKPVVLEMRDDYAIDSNSQHRNALELQVEKYVDIRTRITCTAITDKGVEALDENGKRVFFPADAVVLAVGYRALSDTVEKLRETAPEFMWIGDCYRPGKIADAVSMGYNAALDI